MTRQKSEEKRTAILHAATHVIVAKGLRASTAEIANEAGIASGSLFTYFKTKSELLNELYLELKVGMASAALDGLQQGTEPRKQLFHVWSHWMTWAAAHPEKRRALAQLDVSSAITPATRAAAHKAMTEIAELMERSRANGPMQNVPLEFVAAIMNALAEATMDFMVNDPMNADNHCNVGFDALWRTLS